MVYLTPFFFIVFFIFIYDFGGKYPVRKPAYILMLIWLVCISGFQFEIGTDTEYYMLEFSDIPPLSQLESSDFLRLNRQPGWIIFFSFCKTISADYSFFKILQALFLNSAFFWFIWKYSKCPFVSLLLYALLSFLPLNFETMRESFAIACFVFSFPFLEKGSYLKYYLGALIALSFHISAIVLFVVPLLKFLRVNYTTTLRLIPLLLIFIVVLTIYPIDTHILDLMFDERLAANASEYLEGQTKMSFPIFYLLIMAFEYIIFLFYVKNGDDNQWLLRLFLFAFILSLFGRSLQIAYRFSRYFCVMDYVCTASMVVFLSKKIAHGSIRTIIVLLIITIFTYSTVSSYFQYNTKIGGKRIDSYYPYKSIFDK